MRTRALARLASARTCFMTDCLTEEESIVERVILEGLDLVACYRNCLNCSGRWVERFWRWKAWSCKIIVAECGVGTWSMVTKWWEVWRQTHGNWKGCNNVQMFCISSSQSSVSIWFLLIEGFICSKHLRLDYGDDPMRSNWHLACDYLPRRRSGPLSNRKDIERTTCLLITKVSRKNELKYQFFSLECSYECRIPAVRARVSAILLQ